MKKLTRKLFLSVAALAVCAATLVSTTFAWYVSNSEANVSGITGSTAAAGAEGNILVANDNNGTAGNFMQNLNLSAYLTQPAEGLTPVTYLTEDAYVVAKGVTSDNYATKKATLFTKSGETYEAAAETYAAGTTYYEKRDAKSWVDAEGSAVANGSYLTFRVWLLSTSEETIVPTITIKNTTTAYTNQTLTNTTGAPTEVQAAALGSGFAVDATYALRMSVQQVEAAADLATAPVTIYNPAHNGSTNFTIAEPTVPATSTQGLKTGDSNKYYAAILGEIPFGCTGSINTTYKYSTIAIADAAAFAAAGTLYTDQNGTEATEYSSEATYYTRVVDQTIATATSPAETATPWNTITVEANTASLFEFKVWLEGTDTNCFDSCKGQSFSIDIKFAAQE